MPNIGVDDIMLATMNGVCLGQRVMNTFVYRCTATPSGTSDIVALDALHTKWMAPLGLIQDLISCTPENCNWTEAWYQIVRPTRYRKVVRPIGSLGAYPGDAATANLQGSITRFGELATKRDQGGIRLIIGTTDDNIDNGFLDENLKISMAVLATEMQTTQATATPSVTWVPQVGLPADGAPTRRCVQAVVQDTVRVLRRRTVGLGI